MSGRQECKPADNSPWGFYPYIKVGVAAHLAGTRRTIILGVQCIDMKGENETLTFESRPCPDCGQETGMVHLGTESPREVCGRFGCDWDGITLTPESEAVA